MESSDYVAIIIWINIHVCLPFTFMVIALCYGVQLDFAPRTCYINLLISDVIHLIALLAVEKEQASPDYIGYYDGFCVFSGMLSLFFRMIIALERHFFICNPQLHSKKTKRYVILCILTWVLGFVLYYFFFLYIYVLSIIISFIPAPVFIFCLFRTLKLLPAATSLPAEEKHRAVGSLFLLLVTYCIMILPITSYFINPRFYLYYASYNRSLILFLLNPVMDLILFVFLCEGPIEKMLMCVCCCGKEITAGTRK